ncbi:hypothetical protein ADL15_33635 [Actinoplanes awajinensis subsp. mycoplanecinus]|uniref:Uncharacterized protein n=2 Tax=Actinoplanes awajinensis TaxID=135946 RepID=A0A101JJ91_9ACTN|nr:hypothetical protein ADL15_33635 [Actinoplanes awajinensis subsp. mycoplanecinus]
MNGLALLLFGLPGVIEPAVVAFAATGFPEVADASPFGREGTVIVGVVAAVAAAVGAIVAWRGVSGPFRAATAILLGIVAALVALMAFAFLVSGTVVFVLGVLMIHTAIAVCVIGREVLRPVPARGGH